MSSIKYVILLTILFSFTTLVIANRDYFVISFKNNTEIFFDLGEKTKLIIDYNNIKVISGGISKTFTYSLADTYYFTKSTLTDQIINKTLSIYPNPTSDYLFIKGVNNCDNIMIFDLLGSIKYIDKRKAKDNTIVMNVSNLINGVYVMKINNQQIKFIKQ